jgi:WXG100 family type VII secretion target
MSELQVGTEEIRGAGLRAHALMTEFAEALAQCDGVASGLLAGSWSGPASAMFESGWAEWHRGALEVQEALAGIGRLLGASAEVFETTESDIARAAAGTTGGSR